MSPKKLNGADPNKDYYNTAFEIFKTTLKVEFILVLSLLLDG